MGADVNMIVTDERPSGECLLRLLGVHVIPEGVATMDALVPERFKVRAPQQSEHLCAGLRRE